MRVRLTAVLFIVLSGFVLVGVVLAGQAKSQPTIVAGLSCNSENLLANPSFESGDYSPYNMAAPGHPDCQTWDASEPNQYCERVKLADEWHPWWRDEPRTENWMNIQPEYVMSTPQEQPPRVRTGEKSQHYYSFWSTMEAGLYQQVTAVPGATYCFSAWGHAWSARTTLNGWLSDPNDHGELHQRVGIDPTGGTDWESPNIIWSDSDDGTPGRMQYDTFGQFAIEAVAEAETVTVFMWSRPNIPVKHNDVYWDDAELTMAQFATVSPENILALADVDVPELFTRTIAIDASSNVSWTVSLSKTGAITPTVSPLSSSESGTVQVVIDSDGYALGSYETMLHITFGGEIEPSATAVLLRLLVVEEVEKIYLPAVLRP